MVLSDVVAQAVHQRETAHQVNLWARGVEDARVPTFIRFSRDVDEAFVDSANHFGVYSDLLIEGTIFGDGEVVAFKKVKNPLKTCIGNLKIVCLVKVIRFEQTTVEIGG